MVRDDRPRWARSRRRKIPTLTEYREKSRDDQIAEIGKLTRMRSHAHNPAMGLLLTALGVLVAAIAFGLSAIPPESSGLELTHCRPVEDGFDCWRPYELTREIAAIEAAIAPLAIASGLLFVTGFVVGIYTVLSQRVPWIEQRLEEYRLHLKPEQADSWQMELGWLTIPIKPHNGKSRGAASRSTAKR